MRQFIGICATLSMALTSLPVYGAETESAKQAIHKQKYLMFSDAYEDGTREIPVEIYADEIYAAPESIGEICGADVTEKKDQVIFDRGGYQVVVDLGTETAMLYNQVKEVSRQVFSLSLFHKSEEQLFFPLEKTMYLLNMGWQIAGEGVLVEKPPETLWNTLNEYESLVLERPMTSQLMGDGFLERMKNSSKYTLWAMADDLDYRLFVPFGDYWVERDRCMDAIYSLGYSDAEVLGDDVNESLEIQLSGLTGMMRDGYGNMDTLTDIPQNISDLGAFAAENMGKPFNRWENLQDSNVAQIMAKNKEFSNMADAFTWISAAFEVAGAVSRVKQWSDSYVGQMQTLSTADADRYTEGKDKVKRIISVAQEAYEYSQSIPTMAVAETVKGFHGVVGSALLGLTPVGKVLDIYNMALDIVSAVSPELQAGLQMGEDAYEGRLMIELSTVATYHCANLLNTLTMKSTMNEEELQEVRNAYLLLIRTYTRAWDKIIDVKDQEGYSYEGEKEELEEKRMQSYALSVRLNESAQYDNTLMLEEDYGNLYNDDIETGGLREQIPLELVHEKEISDTALPAGNVAQASDGTIYYWEYHNGSFEAEAPLANYQPVVGAVNRLMERKPSGETVMLAETEGSGTLVLAGDVLLFEKPTDMANHTEIMAMNLPDLEIKSLGEGKLLAVSGQIVICSDNERTQMDSIYLPDGTRRKIADGSFLTVSEGNIYYQPTEPDETAARKGQVSLAVMEPDGSNGQVLCTTKPDLSDGSFSSPAVIVHMVFREDAIYFSYGSYAGTALEYQGGRIMRVSRDGSQAEVVAGSQELQGAVFFVSEDGTVSSDAQINSTVAVSPMDSYYVQDGRFFFFDGTGAPEALVEQADYASFADIPCGQIALQGESLSVRFAERIGDHIYLQLEVGEASSSGSMGWRTNMVWKRGAMLCKDLSTGQTEEIYSF